MYRWRLRNFLGLALHSFNKSFFFFFFNTCIRKQLDPKGTKQRTGQTQSPSLRSLRTGMPRDWGTHYLG